MDQYQMRRELDRVKSQVFMGKNAALLGSVMSSLGFLWDHAQPDKVWTDGVRIGWGPNDFLRCCPREKKTTWLHEVWHPARLHHLRCGSRDPVLWNLACDYRINNDLRTQGEYIPDTWIVDLQLDRDGILSEEEIYELLLKKAIPVPTQAAKFGAGDLILGKLTPIQTQQMVATITRAIQHAEMAGQAGSIPGNLKQVLSNFLEPRIAWEQELLQFQTDLLDEDYTWRKPNRRYTDFFLPTLDDQEGRLVHLAYFIDNSGSITEEMIQRFLSEVKYIWEVLRPHKLTLIQFDTVINGTREFQEGDTFEEIEIVGRGGTSLVPVRDWIEEHQPTAAVIFSDLQCAPMQVLTVPVPVIWAVMDNPRARVPFGRTIHVTV